jgi:hypothetical protein
MSPMATNIPASPPSEHRREQVQCGFPAAEGVEQSSGNVARLQRAVEFVSINPAMLAGLYYWSSSMTKTSNFDFSNSFL